MPPAAFATSVLLPLLLIAQEPSSQIASIVAHRGFKNVAPENTIAAFDAAAKAGAKYVEVDVRATRDGHLVLMHDATVDRTTNGHGAVKDLTFEEIRKLDAGGGERVPTLRETLEWGKRSGVKIDIDHKSGDVEAIAAAVREAGAIRNVVIEGGYETLARFVRLLPGVDTMPKVKSAAEVPQVCGSLKTTVVRLSIEQLRDPSMVRAVNACGARVSVTILGALDNENGIAEVIQRGAQLIETDHPDLVSRVLKALR